MSVAEGDAHVTERTEGETARHERRRGGTRRPVSPAASSPPRKVLRQPERLHVSLGRFRGTLRGGRPWKAPKATFFAADGAEGDGFGAESVALAGFRGSGGRGVPAARVVSS